MRSDDERRLDSFERALLLELRAQVEHNAENSAAQLATSTLPRTLRRGWLVTAAAGTIAVLLVALLMHMIRPEPAFAVTGRNGSTITVRVARLEGPGRLEKALRDRGVDADITYLPAGKRCADPRYTDRPTPGLRLAVSVDRFTVTIPPDAVGPHDTFVLSASVTPLPDGLRASVDYGIATGPVSPCQVIDAP